jgi:hypothetical protein
LIVGEGIVRFEDVVLVNYDFYLTNWCYGVL